MHRAIIALSEAFCEESMSTLPHCFARDVFCRLIPVRRHLLDMHGTISAQR
jgi:hypothetical protein